MMLYKLTVAQNVTVLINIGADKSEAVINATASIMRSSDSSVFFTKTAIKETSFTLKTNTAYILKITAVNVKPFYRGFETSTRDTSNGYKAIG